MIQFLGRSTVSRSVLNFPGEHTRPGGLQSCPPHVPVPTCYPPPALAPGSGVANDNNLKELLARYQGSSKLWCATEGNPRGDNLVFPSFSMSGGPSSIHSWRLEWFCWLLPHHQPPTHQLWGPELLLLVTSLWPEPISPSVNVLRSKSHP